MVCREMKRVKRLKFSVCSEISVVGEAVRENEDGLRRTLSGEG